MKPDAALRRREVAQETLAILEAGEYYLSDGRTASIRAALETACTGTILYRPEDYNTLLAQVKGLEPYPDTTIALSSRSTLAAAQALAHDHPGVAALNFASAKNPGGGFLSGAQAQEESLARASGLYAALATKPEFYHYHQGLGSSLYSDHVIYSPAVPVFHDDADRLIDTPWQTAFITTAAVNAGALVQKHQTEQLALIEPIMERRVRMVLGVAAIHRCGALVLGAWGCGAFRNDPATIAAIFARVLAEPLFQKCFRQVEFAIYDRTPGRTTLAAFERAFA